MLLHRVLTALVGVPIILAAIWFGPPWLTLLAVAAAAIGVWEAYRLNPPNGTDTVNAQQEVVADAAPTALPALLGAVWAVALVLAGELAASPDDFAITAAAICAAGCIAAALWMIAAWRGRRPVVAAAYLVIAPVYVGGGLACALAIRRIGPMPDVDGAIANLGLWWLLLAILTVYAADTSAYTVGRLIGRRPMAPNVSPGKTWEGAAAGLVGAAVAAAALAMLTPLTLQLWQAAAIGVILGIVSPAGDLLESKVKRWAGAKDSGNLFPGHGGMLDRLDSLLPSFIVVYIVAAYSAAAN
ncbi:MAG: phosphatidate cytidylyltransferase [Chloroflexi bacterium]|nr:phosphatidate cytidylyltransferase [Chloroflexota bacterium]